MRRTGTEPHHKPAAVETGTVTGCGAAPRSARFRTALDTPNLYDLPSEPASSSRITLAPLNSSSLRQLCPELSVDPAGTTNLAATPSPRIDTSSIPERLRSRDKVYSPGCNRMSFQYACAGRVKVPCVMVSAPAAATVTPRRVTSARVSPNRLCKSTSFSFHTPPRGGLFVYTIRRSRGRDVRRPEVNCFSIRVQWLGRAETDGTLHLGEPR
jgi:hypothetical protein